MYIGGYDEHLVGVRRGVHGVLIDGRNLDSYCSSRRLAAIGRYIACRWLCSWGPLLVIHICVLPVVSLTSRW
jgi:hypothetical protein